MNISHNVALYPIANSPLLIFFETVPASEIIGVHAYRQSEKLYFGQYSPNNQNWLLNHEEALVNISDTELSAIVELTLQFAKARALQFSQRPTLANSTVNAILKPML